jgi:hypothetical protein
VTSFQVAEFLILLRLTSGLEGLRSLSTCSSMKLAARVISETAELYMRLITL